MKSLALLSFLLASGIAQAQMVSAVPDTKKLKPVDTFTTSFIPHSVIATLSVGFIDDHRQGFKVPAGFEKNNTSGFAPIYGRIEYGVSSVVGIGLTLAYDGYYGNYYQLYTANGRDYKRYKTDETKIYTAGLSVYYHFNKIIPVKRLDVFVGAGFLLNNEHHSAQPQGDSIVSATNRNVAPSLRAGARYYIANKSSVFVDAGYDKESIFSVGYSCRFMKKRAATAVR